MQTYIHNFHLRYVIWCILKASQKKTNFCSLLRGEFFVTRLWLQAKIYTEKWSLINGYIVSCDTAKTGLIDLLFLLLV